jgi:hypothetical protein
MTPGKPGSRSRGDGPPDPRGELQRRVGAILEAGADRNLSRSSLRVFLRCRQWARFDGCTFRVSLRTLAKALHCSTSTAKRGLKGLVEAGILCEREETAAGCRVFEIAVPESVQPAGCRNDRGKELPWE